MIFWFLMLASISFLHDIKLTNRRAGACLPPLVYRLISNVRIGRSKPLPYGKKAGLCDLPPVRTVQFVYFPIQFAFYLQLYAEKRIIKIK